MTESLEPVRVSMRLNVATAIAAFPFAVITIFSRLEDAQVALLVWGGFLLLSGALHTIVLLGMGRPRGWWTWWVGHSVSAVALGVFALWFAQTGSVALLIWSIAVWAVLAGASSLVQGLRQDRRSPVRSDWTTLGGGTMFLGLLVVIVPPEVYWMMGLAGVWAAMVIVFVIIATLSARSVIAQHNSGQEEGV